MQPLVFPAGDFCMPAEVARHAGLRRFSLPLDWVFTNADFVACCVARDWEPLLNMVYTHGGRVSSERFDGHDIPVSSVPHEDCAAPAVRQKFVRRICRAAAAIADATLPLLFLRMSYKFTSEPAAAALRGLRDAAVAKRGGAQNVAVLTVLYEVDESHTGAPTFEEIERGIYRVRVRGPAAELPGQGTWQTGRHYAPVAAVLKDLLLTADGVLVRREEE